MAATGRQPRARRVSRNESSDETADSEKRERDGGIWGIRGFRAELEAAVVWRDAGDAARLGGRRTSYREKTWEGEGQTDRQGECVSKGWRGGRGGTERADRKSVV